MLTLLKKYSALIFVIVFIILGTILAILGYDQFSNYVLIAGSVIVTLRLGSQMIDTLRKGQFGVDILAITAVASTLLVGEYWASAVIVLMLTGGEALETFASNRAKRELTDLLKRAPQSAHLIQKDGTTVNTQIQEIKKGDHLLVRPGEVVPVDSTLESPTAELDESSLTGESMPVTCKKSDQLLSGSVNSAEPITVIALCAAKDSQYQKIIELVSAATNSKAPFVRLADTYAIPFTIVSFAIAGVAWAISGEPVRFAEVLVLATPCPLLLATPIALISGMSRSAKNGIIVKSGGVLERLSRVKTVAFDKTGTLTKGIPEVSAVTPVGNFSKKELLLMAASAEQESLHTLAAALIKNLKDNYTKPLEVSNLKEVVGHGISATIKKQTVLVGKADFLRSSGISVPKKHESNTSTSVWVAIDNVFAGTISFKDSARDESISTIKHLKKLGIKSIVMLTGDASKTANEIGKKLGIHNVHSGLLPSQKVDLLKKMTNRPVMMVGDGVNDAPVLASSDVGVAMGARGSTAASETADVVVLVDDLSKAWQSIFIAQKTISIALQGIGIGIGLSVILMLIATTGIIPAVVGAGLQEIIDIIVIFNALRVHSVKF